MADKDNKKKRISPLAVGLAGTAAVAAGVAAVALSKKENRKKAGKVLKDIKSKGEDLTKHASKTLDKALREEQKLRNTVKKITKKAKNGAAKVKSVKIKPKATTKSRSTRSKQAARTASM